MRLATVLSVCAAAVLLTACTETKVRNSFIPLGQACPDAEGTPCVEGTSCLEGRCTTGCQTSSDCWSGAECRPLGDARVLTCVVPHFIRTAAAQPGTSCAAESSGVCAADPQCDPVGNCAQSCTTDAECTPGYGCSPDFNVCLRELFCYNRRTDDPDAMCTQQCDTDLDCPATLYCEYVASDTNPDRKICVRRTFCAPCEFDSDCDLLGGVCATDDRGQKFCTTECIPPIDPATVAALPVSCQQDPDHPMIDQCREADPRFRCVYNDAVCKDRPTCNIWWLSGYCVDPNVTMCPQPFSVCKDDGAGRNLCYHRYGSCVGDGGACSPCRSRKDCSDAGNGALCYRNSYSNEKFCTVTCGTTCSDSSYACFDFIDDCEKDSDCIAPGATCDQSTLQCTPSNPGECIKDFDWGCQNDASNPYMNPKYPTCYQDIAGPNCFPIG